MSLSGKQALSVSWFSNAAIIIMAVMHTIGIAGLNNGKFCLVFESLAAVNLLLSFLMIITFQRPFTSGLLWFSIFGFAAGMGAEIAGVNTGYPFGSYYYTKAFGWHFYGVPVIIGVNWVLLSYVTGVIVNGFAVGTWQKILAASVLMVVIDLLLEGFAIRHHLWIWQNGTPPVQNYVSWFFISAVIQFAFRKLIPTSANAVATAYLIILLLFLFTDLLLAFVA